MQSAVKANHVVVVGGGFTGLSAAYELVRRGIAVTVLEAEEEVGGLAGSFDVEGTRLERFYHHWFNNDQDVMRLIKELGLEDEVILRSTQTGMYFAQNFYRMSTPLDLLRFTPLSLVGRVRLGLCVLRARRYKNWRELDSVSATQWLTEIAGSEVFRVVWEPLLTGKFGSYADQVSAAWFWAKLRLRGGSRGSRGQEQLAYFRGGFAALADRIVDYVSRHGGSIRLSTPATGIRVENGRVTGVIEGEETLSCDAAIMTPALPIIADLVKPHVAPDYLARLRAVDYLANVCLVLQLDRSLSGMYWMNVNDPSFPFVGIIEHTNFEPPASYGGRHIVYLSKYLSPDSEMYELSDAEVLDFALPHIRRMFPDFDPAWIKGHHVWRARFAQPVVGCGYARLIPDNETPLRGLYISTMAQVYPEDRGTNYAIRDGRAVVRKIVSELAFT